MYDQKAETAIPIKSHPSLVQVPEQSQCLDPGALIEGRLYPQGAELYNITQVYVVSGLPILTKRNFLGSLSEL